MVNDFQSHIVDDEVIKEGHTFISFYNIHVRICVH